MMKRLVATYRHLQAVVIPERHMVNRFITTHLPGVAPVKGPVLDVGAGTAPFAPALLAAAPGMHHVALDHIANDTTAVVADAFSLPFASEAVGLTCYFQVLAHLPDPDRALAEARRVLMPGGCLLISYPLLCPQGRSRDLWRWTLPGMERLLDRAGFDIIAQEAQGGIVSYFIATLALIPGRLLVAHRQGWRSGRSTGDALRLGLAFLLSLPFHLLGFPAWALDRWIDPRPAFYIGGMVLARRREGDG